MSAWGNLPWDNDAAADWFGDTMDNTNLALRVEEALLLDPESSFDEIRAAATLFILLGRTYIWPIDKLDKHLDLAIDKLELIREIDEIKESPEIVESIENEISILKLRKESGDILENKKLVAYIANLCS